MSPTFVEPSLEHGMVPVAPARELPLVAADGGARVAPPPDDVSASSACAPHGNPQQNGRQPAAAPFEPLALRWRAPLDAAFAPASLLAVGGLVAVAGELRWVTYREDGAPLAGGGKSGRAFGLDPRRAAVVLEERGDVAAYDARSGASLGRQTLYHGDTVARALLAPLGDLVVTAGAVMPHSGDDDEPLGECALEVLAVTQAATGLSIQSARALLVDAPRIVAAAGERFIAAATDGALDVFSPGLDHLARFSGEFSPLALSIGGGRVAMIVQRGGGVALWLVSDDGLLCDLPLGPPPTADGYAAPLVGYDHRVYVPLAGQVVVVHPEGTRLDEYPVARFGGAAIDAADTLLLADGSRLIAFRGEERVVLFAFGDETLRAAPVVTAAGSVLCVTDAALYCLGPHS